MANDRKTPQLTRKATHGDRNENRRAVVTPPRGVAAPEFINDEITGQYEGEDLQEMRRRRNTGQRVDRLEVKHDELSKVVNDTRVVVGEIHGQMKVLPELVDVVRGIADRAGQAHIKVTETELEIGKARAMEPLEVRRFQRKLLLKVLGVVGASGVIGAVVHWLLGRHG